MKTRLDMPQSRFLYLQCLKNIDNYAIIDYIKGLAPSTLDIELQMFQIIDDDQQEADKRPELESIEQVLDYFIHDLSYKNYFEFQQAVIRLFLKIHRETIQQQSCLQEKARKLLDIQCMVWQRINKLFQSARCVVAFCSNSQI
ncbi:putative WD repeat-containing protein [Spatholobus suberectus]|nr:putative WD repeat-containing protein [Spatholobus suberectus]